MELSYLGVALDMAGCPNRCRHCWLGALPNGNLRAEDLVETAHAFRAWRGEDGNRIGEFSFYSWWREPDFRDDYRELWQLEQSLSSPGRAQRFELLSAWRLARDEGYARWAATLPPRKCQLTFFGMEESTDWAMRRKGAFREQLLATKRLFDVGITPRWQLFLTKRCLGELDEFMRLMREYHITDFFIGAMSPEGSAYALENLRLEEKDVARIPRAMLNMHRNDQDLLAWKPERELVAEMLRDDNPPNASASTVCLYIDARFDVYPNIAEPAPWWRLGNLKTDGPDAILRALGADATPGMVANRSVPISELAKRYGDPSSEKLYIRDDLLCRFLHEWGLDYMEGLRA